MGNRNAVGKKGNGKLGNLVIVFVHGSFCPVLYFVLCASIFIHCTCTRAEHAMPKSAAGSQSQWCCVGDRRGCRLWYRPTIYSSSWQLNHRRLTQGRPEWTMGRGCGHKIKYHAVGLLSRSAHLISQYTALARLQSRWLRGFLAISWRPSGQRQRTTRNVMTTASPVCEIRGGSDPSKVWRPMQSCNM